MNAGSLGVGLLLAQQYPQWLQPQRTETEEAGVSGVIKIFPHQILARDFESIQKDSSLYLSGDSGSASSLLIWTPTCQHG
jgi:hypothetical protein